MDSMRSLNTSLPNPQAVRPAPPEQLLQAFRTAALSVTNLYKAAVTDQNNSRAAGYQDALDDLLSFLDKENLGLQDGEGWRVRQWATERYDGTALHNSQSEDDEDKTEVERTTRHNTSAHQLSGHAHHRHLLPQQRSSSEPVSDTRVAQPELVEPDAEPIFKFTGRPADQTSDDMQTDTGASGEESHAESSSSAQTQPVKVEVRSVGTRSATRPATSRHNIRSSNREFTFTAGTKRKLQFPDFFDISNIDPRDENEGGTKRGRLA